MNYDIQIIVVILKVTTRFFNNDLGLLEKLSYSFGVTHAQYELRGYYVFRFIGADSIVNNNDIALSEHLSW